MTKEQIAIIQKAFKDSDDFKNFFLGYISWDLAQLNEFRSERLTEHAENFLKGNGND